MNTTLRRGLTRGLQRKMAIQRRHAAVGATGSGGYAMWGALAVVGAGSLTYAARLGKNKALKAEDVNDIAAIEALGVEELKKHGVTLYRYLTCPFCGKVKAFLDHYKIPYKMVEVDPFMKSQMKGLGYSKVPFVKVHTADPEKDINLADSYEIVSLLGKKLGASNDTEATTKWRKWVAEEFIRYLTLNLNRTLSEAWASAAYIDMSDEIPPFNKFMSKAVGAPAMYLIVQHMVTRPKLKKLGYDGGDERLALYTQLNTWIDTAVEGKDFYGGKAPNAADLDVYGVINAIRGFPLYRDVLENTKAKEWIGRMDVACGREPFQL